MNIYKLLKLVASKGLPTPIKLLGLAGMLMTGRRTLGIFFDPTLSCNLKCKMCYFSDAKKRSELHGTITDDYLDKVQKSLFHRALKLQIGCGAEPTLYTKLTELIKRGKESGIPYISLTTNGQLIANDRVNLQELVNAGLDEITLSLHGTTKKTYEYLMPGAKFENLLILIEKLATIKRQSPNFKIRVNYTINSLNIGDLYDRKFWKLWDSAQPNIIQLRPVQNMGDTEWSDFNPQPIKDSYERSIGEMVSECDKRHIICIAPTLDQIDEVATPQDGASAIIEDITYCYISPSICYKSDFDLQTMTYEKYHKINGTFKLLIKSAFSSPKARLRNASKKLNYNIN